MWCFFTSVIIIVNHYCYYHIIICGLNIVFSIPMWLSPTGWRPMGMPKGIRALLEQDRKLLPFLNQSASASVFPMVSAKPEANKGNYRTMSKSCAFRPGQLASQTPYFSLQLWAEWKSDACNTGGETALQGRAWRWFVFPKHPLRESTIGLFMKCSLGMYL